MGLTRANYYALTARIFPAAEEKDSGLFTKVVPKDKVFETALALATQVANLPPIQVSMTKALLERAENPEDAHLAESKCIAWAFQSRDAAEGIMSFFEKRKPKFDMSSSKEMPEFYPWWRPQDVRSPTGQVPSRL